MTLRDWLRFAVTRFNRAGIFCGHGLIDSYDEAAYLLLHTLALPLDRLGAISGRVHHDRGAAGAARGHRAASRRTYSAAYLTGEAWLGDFRFKIDPAIIPRSYFAELLDGGLDPWIGDPASIGSALDM